MDFNDLLHSSSYRPVYTYRQKNNRFFYRETGLSDENTTRFYVGGDVICPCCNEQNVFLPEIMICNDCEMKYCTSDSNEFYECDCCGSRTYTDDLSLVDDQWICQDCIDTETETCCNCGEIHFKDMFVYDRYIDKILCRDCYYNM